MIAFLLQCLGFLAACSIVRSISPFIVSKISGPKFNKKVGKWAVVTGATDGIGAAYCEELAKRGFNLVLISRTLSKLKDCAAKHEQYSIETKIVAADFEHASEPGFIRPIAEALDGLEIGVLVNNVGVSYEMPVLFSADETTDEFLLKMDSLNSVSVFRMTKLVLPGMVARKGGFIINISSAAGVMPCGSPMLAGYSATKASMAALSKSIQYEVAQSGVVCQVHAPYFVVTKMSKIRKPSMMTPTPQVWVKSSLNMLGHGGTVLVPYFPHCIQDFLVSVLPEWVSGWYTLRLHKDIQRRAIRKKEREARQAEEELKSKSS